MITECRTDELLLPTLVTTDELQGFLNTSPAEDDVEQDELDDDEEEGEEDEEDDEAEDDNEDDDDEDDEDEDDEDEDEEDEDDGAPREAVSSARLGSVMLPRLHQLRPRVADRTDLDAVTPAVCARHLDC